MDHATLDKRTISVSPGKDLPLRPFLLARRVRLLRQRHGRFAEPPVELTGGDYSGKPISIW
ncbi:hypothetical protein [Paenibacillus terreus]|uniref:hypothetical protein n=1 Tax=Paenibacillus terreus TaxID=1387834 RepID=UPI0035CD11A1